MAFRQFGAAMTVTVALALATPAHAVTEIQWWHAMTGGNNDIVNKLAEDFNASQSDYKVVPTYKGSYPDTMNAGIAAFRAGNAPHIMQVFEVGTATMMAATGAVKPVYVLMKEAGEKFDPHRHQAIQMVESDAPANTVVTVYQKGYVLNDRILRPAMVTVSGGPGGQG